MSQQPTLAPCSMPLPLLHHGTEHSGTLRESPCMHISVSPSWLLREPHLQYSSLLNKSLDGLLGDSGHEVRVLWQVLQGPSQSNPKLLLSHPPRERFAPSPELLVPLLPLPKWNDTLTCLFALFHTLLLLLLLPCLSFIYLINSYLKYHFWTSGFTMVLLEYLTLGLATTLHARGRRT